MSQQACNINQVSTSTGQGTTQWTGTFGNANANYSSSVGIRAVNGGFILTQNYQEWVCKDAEDLCSTLKRVLVLEKLKT